jgi:hypothetical protein
MILHTETALARGLREIFSLLEERLALDEPLKVYLAGGMAVHLYTAERVTTDVDAEFSARVYLPRDLVVDIELEDGEPAAIYFDTNYNSSFALMHEDYTQDAVPVDLGLTKLNVHVLSPVDLVVSKIARLADNDKQDIVALVRLGLTTSAEIEHRANEALAGFVGGRQMLMLNVRDAVSLARTAEVDHGESPRPRRI